MDTFPHVSATQFHGMTGRKIILRIVLLMVILLGGLLGWNVYTKAQAKAEREALTSTIPDFTFQSIDGGALTASQLGPHKKQVFIFFNPDCEHCQYEAQQAHKYTAQLAQTEINWIGPDTEERVSNFAQQYGLDTLSHHRVLLDTQQQMDTIFGTKGFPEIWIYDESGKLLKKYHGETKWEAIVNQVNESK